MSTTAACFIQIGSYTTHTGDENLLYQDMNSKTIMVVPSDPNKETRIVTKKCKASLVNEVAKVVHEGGVHNIRLNKFVCDVHKQVHALNF